MDGLVRHRQTKGPETDRPLLNHCATSRLYRVLGNDFNCFLGLGWPTTRRDDGRSRRNNEVTKLWNLRGNITAFEYDSNRNMTKVTLPDSSAHVFVYNAYGQVSRHTLPGGAYNRSMYDSNGYLTKRIADEGGLDITEQVQYDAVGNVTEVISPESNKTWYYYDRGSVLTKKVLILDNADTSKQYATTYWYNASGLTASKKTEHKDQDGTSLTPAEYLETYLYDLQGRVTLESAQMDATNSVTRRYLYNGEGSLSKQTNPNGTAESYVYDERGLGEARAGDNVVGPDARSHLTAGAAHGLHHGG